MEKKYYENMLSSFGILLTWKIDQSLWGGWTSFGTLAVSDTQTASSKQNIKD